MIVTFCLPTQNYRSPIGGFKMVYEYSNRLVEYGFDVNIVYCTKNTLSKYGLPYSIRQLLAKGIVSVSPAWFKLDRRVKRIAASSITNEYIPDGDCIFATAAQTAQSVYKLHKSKGKKYYFIQDYENWLMSEDKLVETYKLGMTNIVVSNWLYKIVHPYSMDKTILIKNPIDTNKYIIQIPLEARKKFNIGMLYHDAAYKGCEYALKSIFAIKREFPEVELYMFGNPKLPKQFRKDWIHYIRHATQEETISVYNNCSIFVCASIEEGFGLTGLESMACGCTFLSSDYQGVREYAKNNVNALLSPIKDMDAMIVNIRRVLQDDKLRRCISEAGKRTAMEFSWEKAIKVLTDALGKEC